MTDAELLEQVHILEDGLVQYATGGGGFGETSYEDLRKVVITDARSRKLVPEFVKANRSLPQFWNFIKGRFAHYSERREFIWGEFAPLHDELEGKGHVPADKHVSDVLSKFDVENVHAVWQKALERRKEDPEGAITSARTLLEAVCKHILDEAGVAYEDGDDLPKLYKTVAAQLNLAPSQHTEAIFKQILGGCTSVVEGLGALRNKLSDSHGKGPRGAKPDTRHAELSVNLAGSMATFLIETWDRSKPKTP